MRILPFLLIITVLTGCASMPLGTMMKLSSMDEQTLWELDPAEIRVKVAMPLGYIIDTDTAELSLRATHLTGLQAQNDFLLEVLDITQSTRSRGLLRSDIAVNEYKLALPDAAIEAFKELQKEQHSMRAAQQSGGYNISVRSRFSEVPEDASSIQFWVDIKLEESADYMTLFNGATIRFDN